MTVKTRDVRPQKLAAERKQIGTARTAPIEEKPANPREKIGGNMPPPDQIIAEIQSRLAGEYANLEPTLVAELNKARDLPKEIADADQRATVATLIKSLNDFHKRAESHREAEKAPYLRGCDAVDGFFNNMKQRAKIAAGILQIRLNDYTNKIAEAERRKREAEAEEAARKARAIREEAERAAAELRRAEQARIDAERAADASARKKLQEQAEARAREELAANAEANRKAAEADAAERAAQRAEIHASAPTADLVRQRTTGGVLMTSRAKWCVIVDDPALVPLETIRAFIPRDEIEKAVKNYAKMQSYACQIPGVRIFQENNAETR